MFETVLDFFCSLAGALPFECMKLRFMQEAFLCVLLTAPLAAAAGIQVVNFRMSFFSDAIGHSAFAGVALGLAAYAATLGRLLRFFAARSARLRANPSECVKKVK